MLAIVTGTADGAEVQGRQYSPEEHARYINDLVERHARLDLRVRLIREDRPESEFTLRKGG